MRVLIGLTLIAAVGTLAACDGDASRSQPLTPRSSLDLHLTGTSVRRFSVPSDFTVKSKRLIQGMRQANGACSFEVNEEGAPETLLDWQTVEKNMSTCQIVIAYGVRGTHDDLPAKGTTADTLQDETPQLLASAAAPSGVMRLLSSRTYKQRWGYKKFNVSVFFLQNELTWAYNGTTVSNGSRIFWRSVTSPVVAGSGLTGGLYEAVDHSTYLSTGSGDATWTFYADDMFCTEPGTLLLSIYNTQLEGRADGSVGLHSQFLASGPCQSEMVEYAEAV